MHFQKRPKRRSIGLASCLLYCALSVLGVLSIQGAEEKRDTSLKQRFHRLKPAECGIGRIVREISYRDRDGVMHSLNEFKSYSATVVAVTSTTCPLSKRYLNTLARLEKTYAKDVQFVFVNSIATDSDAAIRAAIEAHSLKGPYIVDPDGTLLAALGARSSTDCFVIDKALTLCYRGAVDDQYGLGYQLDQPRNSLLVDALDAVLAGRKPLIEATDAPGCSLNVRKPTTKAAKGAMAKDHTYHNRISRIIQANCIECHRAGGVAPFSLTRSDEVEAHAEMIGNVVKNRTMPPWFAAPPIKGASSPWSNDRSLAVTDKSDLETWLASARPLGDPANAPVPVVFANGWRVGEPDVVLQLPAPVAIPAEGVMPYEQIIVETSFPEDKWVTGFDIRPTAREVVHHVTIFVESGAQPEKTGDEAQSTGSYLALYVPGNSWRQFPDGCAKRLPQGARLRFQIHYTPNGEATHDQTQLALVFAKKPPVYELYVTGIVNRALKIPANAAHFKESGTVQLKHDIQIMSFVPHMHSRGKAFRFQAVSQAGISTTLLDIPRYDFNWQLAYQLATPVSLPIGTKVRVTGWYDNSSKNPANPDPTKTVYWGPQTDDEMLVGYVEYIIPAEILTPKPR